MKQTLEAQLPNPHQQEACSVAGGNPDSYELEKPVDIFSYLFHLCAERVLTTSYQPGF
ncbi:MAG: hypothetical protein LUG51_07350 [Tannerellaceae bacterium]|nr:hypothetical protein [Tannerellaceae bacterium]